MKGKLRNKLISSLLAMTMIASYVPATFMSFAANPAVGDEVQPLKLWYAAPVPDGANSNSEYANWENLSLPIGNGYMGATVFGRIGKERIQLNEKTLWTGGPSTRRPNYNGGNKIQPNVKDDLDRIYNSLAAGNGAGNVDALVGKGSEQGGYGGYQNFGDLTLDYKDIENNAAVTNYRRDLDLRTAVAGVSYTLNGTTYGREMFMSYPDNVMGTKLTATGGKLNLTLSVDPDDSNGTSGYTDNTKKNYTKTSKVDANVGDITVNGALDDNQMQFASNTRIVPKDGTVTANVDGSVTIANASEVVIYMGIGTDYKQDYPVYRTGKAPLPLAISRVDAAKVKGYDGLKASHIADYSKIFSRVELNIGTIDTATPTNTLLRNYENATDKDPSLEMLVFQYGRYLALASSREGSLPSNLQGVWNAKGNAPWSSDYHTNINLQMNYWPVYVTNMLETSTPVIEYVDAMREPGRVTAENHANVKSAAGEQNGWMMHTQTNPFGWTAPGWSFDWGWSPLVNAWMMQNVYERYEFTGDVEYLRDTIYPMLRETALFATQYLRWDEGSQRYVSSPSYSPEHGPRTLGNTFDQELAWQLFTDFLTASEKLGVDENLQATVRHMLPYVKPLNINKEGRIKEWYEEDSPGWTYAGSEGGTLYSQHRHISHLLGLYPGKHITPETTETYDAAKLVLLDRGLNTGTGWSRANKINLWARMQDGENTYTVLKSFIKDNLLDNLWDTHAPFQIDGNFGYTSGVAEMLMQSYGTDDGVNYIQPLPAVPKAWNAGTVKGLVARGNFVVDTSWDNGIVKTMGITSNIGGALKVKYLSTDVSITKNGTPLVKGTGFTTKGNMITVPTTAKGDKFVITVNSATLPVVKGTPTAMKAVREFTSPSQSATNVDVSWVAPSGVVAGDTYTVSVKRGSNSWVDLASDVTATTYKDTAATLGEIQLYKVQLNGGGTSKSYTLDDARTIIPTFDNNIIYTPDIGSGTAGAWGKYGSNEAFIEGAVALTTPPQSIEIAFYGTGIKVKTHTNGASADSVNISTDGAAAVAVAENNTSHCYPITGLALGNHTIKLERANTNKMSIIGYEIERPAAPVTTVTMTSETGVFGIATKNGRLQLNATTDSIANKGITWSVTKEDGTAVPTGISISQTGLLTVGMLNATLKVKAASTTTPTIFAEKIVRVRVLDGDFKETIDFSTANVTAGKLVNGVGGTAVWQQYNQGPTAGWLGNTEWYTSDDPVAGAGRKFATKFNGNGFTIHGKKGGAFGGLDVELFSVAADGAETKVGEKVAVSQNGSDAPPSTVLYEKGGLPTGEYKVYITSTTVAGKSKGNLDYLTVLSEPTLPKSYGDLVLAINAAKTLSDEAVVGTSPTQYPQDAKTTFNAAISAAILVANATTLADNAALATAVTTLNNAVTTFSNAQIVGHKMRAIYIGPGAATLTKTTGGAVIANDTFVENNTGVTFKIVNDKTTKLADYEVSSFTVNGVDKKADLAESPAGTYTYTATVTANTEIRATIVKKSVNVTINKTGNGSVTTGAVAGKIELDNDLPITITPDVGYKIKVFKVDNVDKMSLLTKPTGGRAMAYLEDRVTTDKTILVEFERDGYSVGAITITGGTAAGRNTITVDKYISVPTGDKVTLTVTKLETGKGIASVDAFDIKDATNTKLTVTAEADGTYSFIMPASNVTVSVALSTVVIKNNITVTKPTGITVKTLVGTTEVDKAAEGEIVEVQVTGIPAGKEVVVKNGTTVILLTAGKYTFTMPATAVAINVRVRDPITANDVTSDGKVDLEDALLALKGATTTVTLTDDQKEAATGSKTKLTVEAVDIMRILSTVLGIS